MISKNKIELKKDNMVRLTKNCLFLILIFTNFTLGYGQTNDQAKSIDYTTDALKKDDFGKTKLSAYTPEIRANMKKLYENKFGLFVHFGPYAQLEGMWKGDEITAEWIMKRAFIPIKEYEKHAAGLFKPEKFNAKEWVDIAEMAGMKFIVVTSKHHDGFAMYKSSHPYNLVDFGGFGRDILKELAIECSQRDMDMGFYYSQSQDWHEEGAYGNDWDFPQDLQQKKFDSYFYEKVVPQVNELTTNYDDIFMVWFDTPIGMKDSHCEQLMDIIKENQPGALVNSRLGNGYGHFDVSIDVGKTPSVCTSAWLPDLKIPWQTHESVTDRGWGYTSYGGETDRSDDYTQFIYDLCNIVCNGGVYLLNVGPRPDGVIPPSQVNSLRAIGTWLAKNGESIYGADPSPLKFPPFAITRKPGKLYLHLKDIQNNQVTLSGILSKVKKSYCLADRAKRPLEFNQNNSDITVTIPEKSIQPHVTVIVLELADDFAKVIDETLQQNKNGSFDLPVARCEYSVRRIGYNYEAKVTHRWGENVKQGLIWTVNVTSPGVFRVISEDTGVDRLKYEIITQDDKLLLGAQGEIGVMSKKEQNGTVRINKTGRQKIMVYPKVPALFSDKSYHSYHFKGLTLIPVNK